VDTSALKNNNDNNIEKKTLSLLFRFYLFFLPPGLSHGRGTGINSSKKNDQISATKGPLAQLVDKR